MNYELVFSAVGVLAMAGWIALLVSPLIPTASDRIAGLYIPALLSIGYTALALALRPDTGGFDSFAAITELFSHPATLMAGWVHFLAFDLFVGAWICRTGRNEGIRFWAVLPCLPVTFLFGPAGFLCFSALRLYSASSKSPG